MEWGVKTIMKADLPFLFGDADKLGEQTFALWIPKGVQSKAELFSTYEELVKFPDYFGRNWDAIRGMSTRLFVDRATTDPDNP